MAAHSFGLHETTTYVSSVMTTPFDKASFDAAFETPVSMCRKLSRADAEHFVEKGYVVVNGAFSKSIAGTVRKQAWTELKATYGVDEHDRPAERGGHSRAVQDRRGGGSAARHPRAGNAGNGSNRCGYTGVGAGTGVFVESTG